MAWLIIIFVVAVVLSPIMWFKQSPRQKNKGILREAARKRNLQVMLDRRPDARDDERALSCVRYQLHCASGGDKENWVLHRYSDRGWASDWDSWRWYGNQASVKWHPMLSETINGLPLGVTALICMGNSVGMIWDESGGLDQLQLVDEKLQQLREHLKNNC